ncbi:MAG: transposase [Planctomycetota bacterium]
MLTTVPHRKRVRHFEDEPCPHELTFSTYRRLPLLTNDTWRGLLGEALTRACDQHRWHLHAFVFMPEHVHLLLSPDAGAGRVPALLSAIKRPMSYRVKISLPPESSLRRRLTIRQRPGVKTFRFWQEGGGYDRNITEAGTFRAAVDYIHENPVRRGLCVRPIDWRWSSACQLIGEESVTPPVPTCVPFDPDAWL